MKMSDVTCIKFWNMNDNNKHKVIPPSTDNERDPDELSHERDIVPDTSHEVDPDDVIHSSRKTPPDTDEEKDIDDLMHQNNEEKEEP